MRRTFCLLMLCAILLCGCSAAPYPTPETRAHEDILSTGITAEDVLSLCDWMVTELFRAELSNETGDYQTYKDQLHIKLNQETIDNSTAQFISFVHEYGRRYEAYGEYTINSGNLLFSKAPEHADASVEIENVFRVGFHYNAVIDGKKGEETTFLLIPFVPFTKVLGLFGVKQIDVDWATIAEMKLPTSPDYIVGAAYEPLAINRELITNASEEQLWAIYDMCVEIWRFNHEGTLLPADAPYQITEWIGHGTSHVKDYDENHRILKRAEYEDAVLARYELWTYFDDGRKLYEAYNADGNIDYSYLSDQQGKMLEHFSYIYYEGLLSEKSQLDADDKVISTEFYKYDENGVLSERLVMDYTTNKYIIYDKDESVIRYGRFHVHEGGIEFQGP